jgi:fatty-acyl-CoA synthase
LVNTDITSFDRAHKVRAAVGNGLRPEVWKDFQRRFGIPQIFEFYASTEGNASLINMFNKEGAVGYASPLLRKFIPVRLVKFDVENEVPIRDKNGFCIDCSPDEPGELIGKIIPGDPTREFKGYTDKKATEKKILRDVFEKGDLWFRTGDLLRWDSEGNVFFVDRIGDTFRWKGENVATSEVAQVLSQVKGIEEVNVYGVQIPFKDGRAGMASLVTNAEFSLDELYNHCNANLPKFASPVFIRLSEKIEITGTFKHRKVEFVKEGFDMTKIKDPIYFRDDALGKFVPLTDDLYKKLLNNQVSKL